MLVKHGVLRYLVCYLSINIILAIINLNYKTSAMQPTAHLATSKINAAVLGRPKTWIFILNMTGFRLTEQHQSQIIRYLIIVLVLDN